jgi:hypothetical protein
MELLEEPPKASTEIIELLVWVSQAPHDAWEVGDNRSGNLMRVHQVHWLRPTPIDKEIGPHARGGFIVYE